MAVNIFDQNSLMRIGTRQLNLRGPRKAAKPTMVIKRISRPSHTEQWLAHAVHFAQAGANTRGMSLEEVVAYMAQNAGESDSFKARTQQIQENRKRGRYAMADNNIAALQAELNKKQVGGYGRGGMRGQFEVPL